MLPILFQVFGAEQKCASCVHLPSSIETFEWLKAAISRKYPEQKIIFIYTDIYINKVDDYEQDIVEKIMNDELFYPVVTINKEIIAEGNPKLQLLIKKIEEIIEKG